VPDDDHLGGTHSGDPQGYGRRHRRAEEPDEQPRRRRRSMEDNSEGLSVADLVQRHTGSRSGISPIPPSPTQGGRRAMPSAEQPVPRRSHAADGPASRHSDEGRRGEEQEFGRPRPGEATGGPRLGGARRAPGQSSAPRPEVGGRPNAQPPSAPPPGGRRAARQPSQPPAGGDYEFPRDYPAEPPGRPLRQPPADVDFSDGGPARVGRRPAGPDRPGRQPAVPPADLPGHVRQPAPPADLPSHVPAPFRPAGALPAEPPGHASAKFRQPAMPPADLPGHSSRPGRQPAIPPADPPGHASAPFRPPADLPGHSSAQFRQPGPAGGERAPRQPTDLPGHTSAQFRQPGMPPADFAGPAAVPPPDRPSRPLAGSPQPAPRPLPGRQQSGPIGRRPSADDRPSGPPPRYPGEERPPLRPTGPEGDLPAGARESGIRRSLAGEADLPAGSPGQRSTPARPLPAPAPAEPPAQRSSLPPRVPAEDAVWMTTEMEAIGEEVQKRRTIDHTLARFSAVHDELKAEEREKKSKRRKLLPWQHDDGMEELDRLDESVGMQSGSAPPKDAEPEPEPVDEEPRGIGWLRRKKGKRQSRSTVAGRAFAVVAAVLVFVGSGVAWGFKSWIESNSQQVDALDPNSKAIQDAAAQRGDENFLLVGSDTRAGAAAEEGVGDDTEVVGARSDTVMIAHIPENRERVVVVSFPRDLEVTRPECEVWDAKAGKYTGDVEPAAEQVKINTAYQVGGPKCVTKMVQELSGLAINHFVGIDFHGFKDMVDAVEGVEICVERPLEDEVLGTVVPQAGKAVTISGDQALNFVRARKVAGDPTSDYGRIKRQQRFLSSLLRKAMSSEVLLDPGKLTGFVDAFSKSTFGDNIGVDQMFVLGQSMQGIEAGRVTFVTVPTVGEANDLGNEELRVEDTDALFQAIRDDTPLPGEAPVKKTDDASQQGGTPPNTQLASGLRQDQSPVDPKTVKIQVFNSGNDQDGIAGDTADQLADLGFKVVWVDASPERVDQTVIRYSKARLAQAQTLAAAVPGAKLVEDPSAGGAVQLLIGPGFDGEVVSPTGGGNEAPPPQLPEDLSTVNAGDVSCA
jgi:LCP family protein required for cell wall assembly